jgi:hypothetical protein
MLSLGNFIRVNPAALLPDETVKNGGKIVILNLLKTPLNNIAALVIHAKIDNVIERLMNKLNFEIPRWRICRRVIFKLSEKKNKQLLCVRSIEIDEGYLTIFKSVN